MYLTLNGPEWLAYKALARLHIVVTPWGRGVGKSLFQELMFLSLVAKWDGVLRSPPGDPSTVKGVRAVVLMDTVKHFRDVHLTDEKFPTLLAPEGRFGFLRGKINKTTGRIDFPGGSWLQPFAASEHMTQRARGIRCDMALVDECDDVSPSAYYSVALPWFSQEFSLALSIVGGTPRRGRAGFLHQMHQLGTDGPLRDPTVHSFHATYRDAPEHVDPAVVASAKAKAELTGTMPAFKREWECDFDAAEGLVYDMWEDALHVRRPPVGIRYSQVVVGVDWGYQDPAVILVVGIAGHGADATAYVLSEYYHAGKAMSDLVSEARSIKSEFPDARWFADPSQPASIEQLKREAGVRIEGANNKIEQGVACVADRLAVRTYELDGSSSRESRLYVAPECVNLRREMVSYRHKALKEDGDRYSDDIVDKNNHAMDCLRYLCVGAFGFPSCTRTEVNASW